jgi:hypothetical protein
MNSQFFVGGLEVLRTTTSLVVPVTTELGGAGHRPEQSCLEPLRFAHGPNGES